MRKGGEAPVQPKLASDGMMTMIITMRMMNTMMIMTRKGRVAQVQPKIRTLLKSLNFRQSYHDNYENADVDDLEAI